MLAPGLALRAGLGASFVFGFEKNGVFARVSHLLGVSLVGGTHLLVISPLFCGILGS